jgi:hypothetical protein
MRRINSPQANRSLGATMFGWRPLLAGLGLIAAAALPLGGCKDDDGERTPACNSAAPASWLAGTWTLSGHGTRRLCSDDGFNVGFDLSSQIGLRVEASAGSRKSSANGDGGADGTAPDAGATEAGAGDGGALGDGTFGDGSLGDGALGDGALGDGALGDGAASADGATSADGGATTPDTRPSRPSAFDLKLASGPQGFELEGSVQGTCVSFTTKETTSQGVISYTFTGTVTEAGVIKGSFVGSSPGGCSAAGKFEVEIALEPDPYGGGTPPPQRDSGVKTPDALAVDTTCVPGTCVPGLSCGDIDDGCGDTLSCGACSVGSCGGGGTPGVCGCAPTNTAGPLPPGAAVNDKRTGVSAWTNPGEVLLQDGSDESTLNAARATLYTSQATSNYLLATGFGFKVPATALITGVTVTVRRKSREGEGEIVDDRVQLTGNDTLTKQNKAKSAPWTGTYSEATYGGPQDLWGRVWTAADVNSNEFGVALSARWVGTAGNDRALVDYISVTVHYAPSCN